MESRCARYYDASLYLKHGWRCEGSQSSRAKALRGSTCKSHMHGINRTIYEHADAFACHLLHADVGGNVRLFLFFLTRLGQQSLHVYTMRSRCPNIFCTHRWIINAAQTVSFGVCIKVMNVNLVQ
jgi:hypothetical protein